MDDRLIEYEIIRRIKHERRRFDLRRINRSELVCFAQIKEMVRVGQRGARGCRLVEERFDLEAVGDRLCRIFPILRWRRPKCLARPFLTVGLQGDEF